MRTIFYLIMRIEKNKFFRKQTIFAALLYLFIFSSTSHVPVLSTNNISADIFNLSVVIGVTVVYLLMSIAFSKNIFVGLATGLQYYRATPLSDLSIVFYCVYEKIRPILISLIVALIALWNVLHKMLCIPHFAIFTLYLGVFLCVCVVVLIAAASGTIRNIFLRIIFRLFALVPVILVVYCLVYNCDAPNNLATYLTGICLNKVYHIPIIGWLAGIIILTISKQYTASIAYGAFLIIVAMLLWQRISKKRDQIINQAFSNSISRHRKMTDEYISQTFILPSWCVIYERKRIVQRRCGKKPLFNIGTWVSIIGTVILGIGISQSQNEVGDTIPAVYALLISALMGSVFTLCLFANDIDWSELSNPFFRIIPLGAIGKFININLMLYIRCTLVGMISLGIIGVYTGCFFSDIMMAFLVFISLNFVFSCGQIISYKLFGIVDDVMIAENIKMIMNLLLVVPSVVTYIVMLVLGYEIEICTVVFLCVNALVGLVSIYFSKGVLS